MLLQVICCYSYFPIFFITQLCYLNVLSEVVLDTGRSIPKIQSSWNRSSAVISKTLWSTNFYSIIANICRVYYVLSPAENISHILTYLIFATILKIGTLIICPDEETYLLLEVLSNLHKFTQLLVMRRDQIWIHGAWPQRLNTTHMSYRFSCTSEQCPHYHCFIFIPEG
jgi:hypothetical protein